MGYYARSALPLATNGTQEFVSYISQRDGSFVIVTKGKSGSENRPPDQIPIRPCCFGIGTFFVRFVLNCYFCGK